MCLHHADVVHDGECHLLRTRRQIQDLSRLTNTDTSKYLVVPLVKLSVEVAASVLRDDCRDSQKED